MFAWILRPRRYLPDARDLSKVNIPALLITLGLDDVQTLGIAADFGGIQRLLHNVHELSLALLLQQQ